MAGTISVTSDSLENEGYSSRKHVRKVTVDWVADAADGSVPTLSLVNLYGYCLKVITNPGATAPTDNYDIILGDPADNALDALAGALANRDTANTEQVYPTASGSTIPVYLTKGDYVLTITNNAVNSATGRVILVLADSL